MTTRSRFRLPALLLMLAAAGCALHRPGPEMTILDGAQPTPSEVQPSPRQQLVLDMAMGAHGEAYLASMAAKRGEKWEIRFSRSEDGGVTWSGPLWSRRPKEGIFAAGAKLATGPAGQVYLAWREGNRDKTDIRILVARSLDGGRHWDETPRELAAGDHLGFPHLQPGPDGALYVAWLSGDESRRVLTVATSQDSGETFASEPAQIQPALSTSHGITNPRLISDGKGRLYAVWEEAAKRGRDVGIYLSRAEDHGRTWSEPILVSRPGADSRGSYAPRIAAAPDGQVYLIWEQLDQRIVRVEGGRNERVVDRPIYFNRSLDGGRTWLSEPVRLSQPNPASLNRLATNVAKIVCDGRGHVYVALIEWEGAPLPRLLVFHSADSGATWDAPSELGQTSLVKGQPIDIELAHDGSSSLWFMWQEHAFGPKYGWFVLMNRSEDHGQHWADQAALMSGPTVGQTTDRDLALRVSENGLVLAAWDHGDGLYQPIALSRSVDGGKSWSRGQLSVE